MGAPGEPRAVDAHGYEATLVVDQALVGDDPTGAELRVAWEELARGATPRLRAGKRVVVGLEPLPTQSLWRSRFPDGGVRVVAGHGAAFWLAPDPPTLAALGRYLSLAPAERRRTEGTGVLASLAAVAPPALALAALERLEETPALASQLDAAAAARLGALADDPAAPPALRTRVLALAGTHRVEALRPSLERAVQSGAPLERAAREALARLDGGMAPAEVVALLGRDEPGLRVLAVEYARGTAAEVDVRDRVGGDPAPEVRAAAARAWIAWHALDGAAVVEPALFDPEPGVRNAAAESLGALGAPVVPRLVALVNERTARDAVGPLWALHHAGPAGERALVEIAGTHPDDGVRKLAAFVAGKSLSH